MKILILGAGGVGGYFGGQLARHGASVSFLVRPARQARLRADGLRIETPDGAFTVHAPFVTAGEAGDDHDLIVFSPKAYDLDDALDTLAPLAGRACLLPLLNGLDHLDAMDRRFGAERVMGGVAHIAAMLTPEGAVRRMSDLHTLTVGVRHPGQQPVCDAFAAHCRAAPFKTVVSDDIEQTLWDKWTFLATLAAMTTSCRGTVGEFVATSFGDGLARRLYAEALAVAQAQGHPVSDAAQQQALGMLTAAGSPFTASMLRDLQSGQRTEHEHILGALCRRAEAAGLRSDLLAMAYTHLAVQAARPAR
jgi:2-dehydropantoate 2-reductase